MIDWYRQQNYKRYVRDPLAALRVGARESYDQAVYDVVQYFNRKKNMESIRSAMKARFGTAIIKPNEKRDRPDGQVVRSHRGVEYYVRSEVSDAVELGHIEVIDTGIGIRIVQALGNLLNQPDQYWLYTNKDDDDAEQIEDVEALMNEVREVGGYNTIATELDLLSCMVESGILHIYLRDKQLKYDVVLPCNVWMKYGRNIKIENEDGTTTDAFVDYKEIDDASCVIIQTASDGGDYDGAPDENQYVAYVGCCTDHLEGRYVMYHSNSPWPIPDVGDNAVDYEHEIKGQHANPLTWMRHHGTPEQQAVATTEYPIVLWRGGHQMISDDRIPITTSLYDDSVELEIGWSRLARAALLGARGRDLIKMGEDSFKVPQSLDLPVIGEKDSFEQIGWPASHAESGARVFQIITEQVACGFNVPGYMVLGQLSGMNPASGVALAIQSTPLIAFRNRRHKLNRDAMRRQFDIERAMLCMEHKEAQKLLKPDVKQKWDPGNWKMPTDELDEQQAITQGLDNKTIDLVAAVKRKHRLATDSEAEAFIEMMQERDPEYIVQAPVTMRDFATTPKQDVAKPDVLTDVKAAPVAPVEDVQKQALNGAQITAIVDMATKVAAGEIAEESAIEILLISIPGLNRDEAVRMVGEKMDTPPPKEPAPFEKKEEKDDEENDSNS